MTDCSGAHEAHSPQSLWAGLFGAIPFGAHFYRLSADGALVFTGANPAADRILGIDNAQFVGKRIEDAFPMHRETEIPARYREVVRTGRAWTTEQVDYRDGQIAGAFAVYAVATGPDSMAALFEDITERRRGEEALRRSEAAVKASEERYRLLVDTVADLLVRVDSEGRFTYVSPSYCALFGKTEAELLGQTYLPLVHPDDAAATREAVEALGRPPHVAHVEQRAMTREGWRWLAWSDRAVVRDGKVVEIVAVGRDIHEHKLAVDGLRRSEALLRAFLEAMPEPAGVLGRDGRLIEANRAVERECGCTVAEARGRGLPELFPGRLGAGLSAGVESVVASGRPVTCDETVRGRLLTVHLYPQHGPGGEVERVGFFCLDVTDQRRAEQERMALQAQVQQTQKLESLGLLAGGIAHDFNNLLCGMLGSAELALAQLPPAHPARCDLDLTRETAQRATDLCKQLLAYSGKGRFVVEPLDLSGLVEGMSQLLTLSVSKKAILRYQLEKGLPTVEADATQLRQIILNLVINASEAIGEKSGVVTLSTGAMECQEDYLATAYLKETPRPGTYVYLEVSDNGCGMNEDVRRRVFDPFFTTKFTGRGLGLAAVLGIVRGHRGTVKLYSEVGRGSSFKVLLPASEARAHPPEHDPRLAERWRGEGTVLLVDDEETVRAIGARLLRHFGFEVLVARDGREGVEVYRAHHPRIRCVILDMTMPHMNGEEAFRELRAFDPAVRVVLTSGYNEQEATNRFAGKGLAAFVQKPFQLATISETLQRVLKG